MTERIPYAFAEAGDTTTVPDESTGTEVSFESGWSSAYALASTETGYRYLDRAEHNYLWNAITGNVKQWQDNNFPEHFPDVDYSIGTITRFSDVNYVRISGTGAVADPSASSDYEEYITPLIATQTEVDTGTDTEKTVTPATLQSKLDSEGFLYDSAKSLTTNGYQTLSNGLIIQWGQEVIPTISTATITYPITFPNAVFSVTVGSQASSNGNQTVTLTSTSQCDIYASGTDTTGTGTKWIAIGY